METVYYKVLLLDGDYARLQKEDDPSVVVPMARALLPMETDEGMRLKYENFEFEIIG